MKITVESTPLAETEVIIRGDATSHEVISLLTLLQVKSGSRIIVCREEEQFPLDAGEIVYLETSGSKVIVHTRADSYESRQKLFELKQQLAPQGFAQINKSTLVRVSAVRSIQAEFSGNYRIKLKDRPDILTVSRKYFKEFRDSI